MALEWNHMFFSCVYQGVLRFTEMGKSWYFNMFHHVSVLGRLGKGWISILDMDGMQLITGLRQQQSRKRPMKEERESWKLVCVDVPQSWLWFLNLMKPRSIIEEHNKESYEGGTVWNPKTHWVKNVTFSCSCECQKWWNWWEKRSLLLNWR